jgi:hypothetical protein
VTGTWSWPLLKLVPRSIVWGQLYLRLILPLTLVKQGTWFLMTPSIATKFQHFQSFNSFNISIIVFLLKWCNYCVNTVNKSVKRERLLMWEGYRTSIPLPTTSINKARWLFLTKDRRCQDHKGTHSNSRNNLRCVAWILHNKDQLSEWWGRVPQYIVTQEIQYGSFSLHGDCRVGWNM